MKIGWDAKFAAAAAAALAAVAATATGAAATSVAGATGQATGKIGVVVSFYPLEEAAKAIAGSRATVTNLTPPGGSSHDLELTPARLVALERAKVVLYLGRGYQPAVEKAVENLEGSARTTDLLTGLPLRGGDKAIPGVVGEVDGEVLADGNDPHVWVDPRLFARIVDGIREAMIAADPAGKAAYTANARRYTARLATLDREFTATLRRCTTRVLVTSHAAFGYLAGRYRLVQAPIAGISPDAEPSPRSIAATATFAKRNKVRTVFFETLVPKKLAETVAAEIGASSDMLDPIEGIPVGELRKGATYFTIQRANLASLKKGLGCTGA